jgi:hypothetical protein
MKDVTLTMELYDRGFAKYEVSRMVGDGSIERLRRGVYAAPIAEGATRADRHRRQVHAAVAVLDAESVISHGSAAVLHGIPGWLGAGDRVQVTRSRPCGGQRRRLVHLTTAPIPPSEVTVIDGVRVTSLARTVLDLGRTITFCQAVASGDRALGLGLDPNELTAGLLGMSRWPGVRAARRTVATLDGRSESVGESFSRVRFIEQGIPTPEPQYAVYDEAGHLLGRSDFGWEEHRTLGEFDGKVKYGELVRPGQRAEDVLFAEKQREDALRDRGWQVVRWTWDDLNRPEVIRDRLLRAFERTNAVPVGRRPPINRPVIRLR